MSLEKDRLIYIIDNELLLRQGNDCEASCNNRKYDIYLYTVIKNTKRYEIKEKKSDEFKL